MPKCCRMLAKTLSMRMTVIILAIELSRLLPSVFTRIVLPP
jgi:hypothetical protein